MAQLPKGSRSKLSHEDPGPQSVVVDARRELTADEMLDAQLQDTGSLHPRGSQDVTSEQPFIAAFHASIAELQQQSGLAERTDTFEAQEPLTPFLAYVLFVMHYRTSPSPESWLLLKRADMREIRDRKRAIQAYVRPWSSLPRSETEAACMELLCLCRLCFASLLRP